MSFLMDSSFLLTERNVKEHENGKHNVVMLL